jgi:hypothetical protein
MNKLLELFNRHERIIAPFFILGGFVLDNLTLRRPDLLAENILLAIYLIIVGVVIILINKYQNSKYNPVFNFLLFFAFGGLFSVFTVFYARSSYILKSWPFLFMLFAAMLSADLLRKQYQRFNVQIGIYFLALFSFLIFHLPTVFGALNYKIFLISGFAALIIIYVYILISRLFINKKIFSHKTNLVIFIIFFVINFMYYLNLIPPIPMMLKETEIGRNVVREESVYKIFDQKDDKIKILGFINWKEKISVLSGQKIYFFSAVFAPIKIQTEIVHHWEFYDPEKREWKTIAKIPISLRGGRDDGYRSYSNLSGVRSGKWRVIVETKNGQVVGAHNFVVEIVNSLSNIETEIKLK